MDVREPVEELRETKLFLHMARQSKFYADGIVKFVSAIAPILATTKNHFPLYTRHDAHHGFRVTRRISQVINPKCLKLEQERNLGAPELFLLIAAAYAHDLGMTVFPGEEDEIRAALQLDDEAWRTDKTLTDLLRADHSKRGGKYIAKNAKVLGVPDNLIAPLDWMMRSHNMSVADLDRELRQPFAVDERILDLRQLAAILCIADALEFSDTRVLDGVLEQAVAENSHAGRISYRENRKHDCIRDSLALSPDGQIVVTGSFNEPEVLALAHHTFDDIEVWLRGYCDIDRESRTPRLQVRPEPFLRRLELTGAKFERLGVRMSKRAVIDLIASNAVWKRDPGVAIRELVQNAVEACRYRRHHASEADLYAPEVRVVFDRNHRTITITDNGCGMSQRTVMNNFLTVGSSRAKEPGYATETYAPIARFGIGFWSVFTIAGRARVETCTVENLKDNGEGMSFEISLDELRDYTVFSPMRRSVGTAVTLHVLPGAVLDEIFEQSCAHLVAAAVPLTMVLDGEETAIPSYVPSVTYEKLLGVRAAAASRLGIKVFQWRGNLSNTEMSMGLAYREVDGRPSFRANEQQSVLSEFDGVNRVRTAVCGFSVAMPRSRTCFAVDRVGFVCANSMSPRGFSFSLDRHSVEENEARQAFARETVQLVHAGYREFLRSMNAYDAKPIFDLNEASELAGGNVFDVYTGEELIDARRDYADLLCFRLLPVLPGIAFNQVDPIYVSLEQLLQMSAICSTIQTRMESRLSDGRIFNLHAESLLPIAYQLAQAELGRDGAKQEMYILDANRATSMLFDGDPDSTLSIARISVPEFGYLDCIQQRLHLENVVFDSSQHDIIAKIQGQWSGAIYRRNFEGRNGKPYAFLGRYRVLVQRGSALDAQLSNLRDEGCFLKMASLIKDLTDDEAGYTPVSLAGLV